MARPPPQDSADVPGDPPLRARAPLAILTGALMVLAFPRYGDRLGLDALIWVTPVPLMLAARGAGWRRGFFLGWLAGMTLECAGFLWILVAIRSFSRLGPVLSSAPFLAWLLFSSLPWGILGWALGRCRHAADLFWVIPLWVGVEHAFPRLFPWHVGGALYAREWLLQCADLVGASGLTALVFVISVVACLLVDAGRGRGRLPLRSALIAGALLTAALAYGRYRQDALREQVAAAPRLRVGIIQGFRDPRETAEVSELELYLERTEDLIARSPPLDLVVWPEGIAGVVFLRHASSLASISPWSEISRRDREAFRRLRALPVPLITGGA
jgi:apolipoprotein N-acyltransferase